MHLDGCYESLINRRFIKIGENNTYGNRLDIIKKSMSVSKHMMSQSVEEESLNRWMLVMDARLYRDVMIMKPFEIVQDPIEVQKYADYVLHEGAGAVTVFSGHVREWTNGIRTLSLAYEAYGPMAEKKLAEIGREIEMKWPGTRVAIAHRIGQLEISDIAVVIAISSPHRKNAYEANEYAIERIKQIVPIWKKEIWENGEVWVGNQHKKPLSEESIK